jgi:Carboxypeptidase regulatory-like domain/TonB dependent receptor
MEVTMPSLKKAVYKAFAALATSCLLIAASAHAQNMFGSIVGSVSDASGAVIPKAAVTVTDMATSQMRTATTDDQGSYEILSLPRGEYKVDIDAKGFKRFSRSPIDVVVDQVARVNVTMQIGEQSQQVTVNAAPPIMQTDSASLGQAVEGKAVETLPLNGRNVLALVALVPGVVPQGSSFGNLSGQNVFAAGNYQIDGGNANQSSVLVDGAPVNTSYGNTVELVMDQDVVQEFNAQTHDNTAEFGYYTGGVINMSTKSGSNAFHGEAYEYLRNTVFDANNFFANHAVPAQPRQAWHQNQFGANFGGPIKKDKVFFFGDYQGYRQTQGSPTNVTVPTAAELTGDFSANTAAIYDPLTTCGVNNNPACVPGQPIRQQFSYNGHPNVIPPSRFSTVATNLIKFPSNMPAGAPAGTGIYALPNTTPGSTGAEGPLLNYFTLAKSGAKNDQYTIRGDQNLTAKDTLFERYTWWKSFNLPTVPYGNGLVTGDPISPEAFTTQQGVVGDTHVFNSTSVADLHLSYLRWNYIRTPGFLGIQEGTVFGFPSYMNFGALNNLAKSTAVPSISTSGPISYTQGGAGYIFSINNNYVIGSTYQKIWRKHTFKTGIDLRRMEMDYFQNNSPGGVFTFDNVLTGANPTSPGTTGNGLASFELGYVATSGSQTVQVAPPTFQTVYYQGYFGQDTWQITNKLTLSLGIRYEVPGVYVPRHGWGDTFNPTENNPVLTSVGNYPGAFDLVSTSQHSAAGVRNENWDDWSPRLGVAYRLNDKTVFRAAWGKYIIPSDVQFPEAPLQAGINFLNNLMVNTINGSATPNNYNTSTQTYGTANTLDNPYPNGLISPPHRNSNYQQVLLGGNPQALLAHEPNGETYQWNVAIERQFPLGIALEAAYSGLRGDNLPVSLPINPLPDSVIAQAAADKNCNESVTTSLSNCFLNTSVTNPFNQSSQLITQGTLKNATVPQNQLLRPFPQYGSISDSGHYIGISNYNALEVKLQKRMSNGGQILGAYTFSKLMTDAEYLTSWLDSTTTAGYSDYNNPMSNYSLSSFDARQRLVVSFLYPLPIGKGQLLLHNLNGAADEIIGGWGFDGITTFQEGYPLGLSDSTNDLSTYAFQGSQRPNVVPGCAKKVGGNMATHLGQANNNEPAYFQTACFQSQTVASSTIFNPFTFGNESRTDNTLRTPGTANWDMSLFKNIPIHESASFEFRVEAFNLFNRVQFGQPNVSVGNTAFGSLTSQYNNPRILQMSGRINF